MAAADAAFTRDSRLPQSATNNARANDVGHRSLGERLAFTATLRGGIDQADSTFGNGPTASTGLDGIQRLLTVAGDRGPRAWLTCRGQKRGAERKGGGHDHEFNYVFQSEQRRCFINGATLLRSMATPTHLVS